MSEIETDIINTIINGSPEELEQLLKSQKGNFDSNYIDGPNEWSSLRYGFLHYAVCVYSVEKLNILLDLPDINVNLGTRELEMTPLYLALFTPMLDKTILYNIVKRLLEVSTIDVNKLPLQMQEENYRFELHETKLYPFALAARRSLEEIVKLLFFHSSFNLSTTDLTETLESCVRSRKYTVNKNDILPVYICNLLMTLGAGIDCKLDKRLPSDLVTKNKIFIGLIKDQNDKYMRITRQIPGFEEALTTPEECLEAIQKGNLAKNELKYLIEAIDKCQKQSDDFKDDLHKIKCLLIARESLSLQSLCLKTVSWSKEPIIKNNLGILPVELQAAVNGSSIKIDIEGRPPRNYPK